MVIEVAASPRPTRRRGEILMGALAAIFFALMAVCAAGCPALMSDDFVVRTVDGSVVESGTPSDSAAPRSVDGSGREGGLDGTIGDGGAEDAASGPDAPDAQVLPRSCMDIRAAGIVTDGTYMIDIDGSGSDPAFVVYCKDMNTDAPTEYLELPANLEAGLPTSNVSGYAGGGGGPGCQYPPATLAFFRVRLNLQTLRIEPSDRTFAYFEDDSGAVSDAGYTGTAAANPGYEYGAAGSCASGGDMSGRGNVDLTGTPFRMTADTTFVPVGYLAAGTSTFSVDRKRVDLTGGGYSGWCEAPPDAGGIGLEFSP